MTIKSKFFEKIYKYVMDNYSMMDLILYVDDDNFWEYVLATSYQNYIDFLWNKISFVDQYVKILLKEQINEVI